MWGSMGAAEQPKAPGRGFSCWWIQAQEAGENGDRRERPRAVKDLREMRVTQCCWVQQRCSNDHMVLALECPAGTPQLGQPVRESV